MLVPTQITLRLTGAYSVLLRDRSMALAGVARLIMVHDLYRFRSSQACRFRILGTGV